MLHKKRSEGTQINSHESHKPELYAVWQDLRGSVDDPDGMEQIPVKQDRELVRVSRQGAKCYRLEKIRCGKKGCRCAGGELHGPYWYAYYRENGRMRCAYMGKRLPEHVSLENRALHACRRAGAERKRAARIVAEVKETLQRLTRADTVEPGPP